MIAAPVVYNGEVKSKVDAYNAIALREKSGDYWDRTDDGTLSDVKRHIKDHYIRVQNYTCPYCQQMIQVDHQMIWDAEHIIPKDSHPAFLFEPENLCVACKDCNGQKRNTNVLVNPGIVRFPRNPDAYLLCHPHFDTYTTHIRVLRNPLFFIPRTKKGRKTVEICGLLRFLYALTEYRNVPIEIGQQIGRLQEELMNAQSPEEQAAILAFIKDRCDAGIELAQRARFAHIVGAQDSHAA